MRTLTHIIISLIATLIAGQSLHAQDIKLLPKPDAISVQPAPQPTAPPKIIFPTIPVLDQDQVPDEEFLPSPPAPKPPQQPKFISELSEETWLVIESPEPLLVTSSPLGHVAIQPEAGPVRVRGKFADGTGKVETRVFKSANLYFINAVSPGKVEILIYHSQLTEEKDIPRYTLTVMGQSPNPPPGPGPKPDPNPKPDPDPIPTPSAEKIEVFIVDDLQNMKPDTAIVTNQLSGWNELKDKGHDWRIYSKNDTTANGLKVIEQAKGTPYPAMVVRDRATAKVIRVLPFPTTFDSFKRVLSELTGGL